MMEDLAARLNVKPKDNWLFFPEDIASGYYRFLQLPNGLDVNIINCRIKTGSSTEKAMRRNIIPYVLMN